MKKVRDVECKVQDVNSEDVDVRVSEESLKVLVDMRI